MLRRTAPPESRLPWLLLLPAAWALLTLEAALLDEFHDDGRPAWTLEVLFAESWPFWPGALAVWAALAFVPWNRLAWSWSAPLRVLLRMAWIGIYPVGITYVACVLYSHALGEDFEFESIWIPQGLRGTFHRVLLDLGTLSSVLVAGTLLHAPPVPHGSRVELQADRVLHPATWLPATVFGIALGLGLFDVRPFRWLLDRPEPVLIVWMSLVSIELVAQALTRRESARRAPRVR